MPNPTLTTAVEKIQPTAIIKLDGAFNDFHAKEVKIVTKDKLPSAHFEHDVAILTNGKTEVLSSFEEIEKVVKEKSN